MKKILLLCGLTTTLALGAYGQGAVNIGTATANAYVRFSNTVAQAWVTGTSPIVWGLYYGSNASSINLLLAGPNYSVTTNGFSAGAAAGFIQTASGGGKKQIDGFNPGDTVYFQLKAWSAGFATYADALGGPAGTLVSQVAGSQLAGPIGSTTLVALTGVPAPPTPNTIPFALGSGASSPLIVNLIPVPEPSMIALGVLGLAGVLFLRRRK